MRWVALAVVALAVSCGEPVASSDAPEQAETVPTAPDSTSPVPVTDVSTTEVPDAIALPVPTTIAAAPMTEPPTTTATPATEHRLEVLTRVLAMPGRPDLVDVEGGGQHVMIDTRELAVNVPISGTWQYADLAAQDVAAASAEESEAAARALLSALGIDATGDVASFEKNGPRVDVSLGACMFRFAAGPRLEWAICPIAAIP